MATLAGESAAARYQFNQLEQWRDRLIAEPDALTEFIATNPGVDRQQLRVLINKVHQAGDERQTKSQAKQLFRFLREALNEEQ